MPILIVAPLSALVTRLASRSVSGPVNPEITNSTPVHPDGDTAADDRHTGEPATGGSSRDTQPDGVLQDGETVVARGRCWAAVRRERVPLLVLARRQYELVLTDRRLLLLSRGKHQRRRLGLQADGVALAQDLDQIGFGLQRSRQGVPLRQLQVALPDARVLVLEFGWSHRALGDEVAGRLTPT
jgi:hypothetical protein